ncbi:hypothetical protein LINGRAHAP2_LOCUS14662 [Linum grandiflorum]
MGFGRWWNMKIYDPFAQGVGDSAMSWVIALVVLLSFRRQMPHLWVSIMKLQLLRRWEILQSRPASGRLLEKRTGIKGNFPGFNSI